MRVIAVASVGESLVAPACGDRRPRIAFARLFSVLADVEGDRARSLCGTGALGIEALSRGAAHATFVENSGTALKALRQNIHSLALGELTTVLPFSVERALKTPTW